MLQTLILIPQEQLVAVHYADYKRRTGTGHLQPEECIKCIKSPAYEESETYTNKLFLQQAQCQQQQSELLVCSDSNEKWQLLRRHHLKIITAKSTPNLHMALTVWLIFYFFFSKQKYFGHR